MELIEPQIDLIRPAELEKLLVLHQEPSISIYMPTHRIWSDTRQDPIRLKNLLREAENRLKERGFRAKEVENLLDPLHELEHTTLFWQTQSDGLALFLSPDTLSTYRLPLNFDELVVVNDRFHIKPLLDLFGGDGRFYMLMLSQGNIRLLAGTHYSVSELDLEGIPTSLAEALQYDVFEKHQQFHSGAAPTPGGNRQAAMYHGHGAGADDANMKKRIVEFFRQVDNGVCSMLGGEQVPLVLAGLEHLQGLYRDVNHYTYLVEKGIAVNPEGMGLDEIHRRAWSLIEPYFQEDRLKAAESYKQLASTEPTRVSNKLEDVVPAAYFKRVKVLYVRRDAYAWGTFDSENQQVEVHGKADSENQDLLDLAVVHTLLNAGTVYLEDEDSMPDNSEVAAIFRY